LAERDPLKAWFCRDILPLEPALTRFIRRNWRNEADLTELRQDIYEKVFEGARAQIPLNAKAYLFATARNHLINHARRARIVSFDLVADLENSPILVDVVTPERVTSAREELRRVSAALDRLPPRRRTVVMLRKIEGLSHKDIAARLGITVSTVEQQLSHGMRTLVDLMLGSGKPRLTLVETGDDKAAKS
jgi:RNA polymerase sigma factor (sigma-70 family)